MKYQDVNGFQNIHMGRLMRYRCPDLECNYVQYILGALKPIKTFKDNKWKIL